MLFNNVVSTAEVMYCLVGWLCEWRIRNMHKQAVVDCFRIKFLEWPRKIWRSQKRRPVSGPRLEPRTSLIRSRSASYPTYTFRYITQCCSLIFVKRITEMSMDDGFLVHSITLIQLQNRLHHLFAETYGTWRGYLNSYLINKLIIYSY